MQFTKILCTLVAGACYGTSSPAPDGNCSSASDNIVLIQRQASVQPQSQPFFKGTKGGVCSQGQNIIDENACRDGASYLGLQYERAGSWSHFFAGCVVGTDGRGTFFNRNAGGGAHALLTPLCQAACPSFPTSKQLLFYEFYKEQLSMNT